MICPSVWVWNLLFTARLCLLSLHQTALSVDLMDFDWPRANLASYRSFAILAATGSAERYARQI